MSKNIRRVRGFRTLAALSLLSIGASAFAATSSQPLLADLVRQGDRDAAMAAIAAHSADVNAKSTDGSTALMWATFNADHEMVQALLKAGAKANVTSTYGSTALTEAIKLEDMELFHTLLDAGANVDSPNSDNQTALMLAISMNNQDIAKDADRARRQREGHRNLPRPDGADVAAGGNLPDLVDLLLAKGAGSQVNLRAKSDDWQRQMTSEPRAQFGTRQTGGLTALLYAIRAGCQRCVVSLVDAGADINKPNPDGVTPLINAIDNRHFDTAMYLLDKGANPNTWDMSGRTPLYMAIDMNSYRAGGGGGGGGGGAVNPGGIGGVVGGPPRGAGGPGGPGGRGPGGSGGARGPAGPSALDVANRLIGMGVDVNHQLTRKRPYGNGRARFTDYDMRGGAGPLFIAALSNDTEAMQLLLAHGAEVDLNNVFQMTPLMVAVGMRGTGRGGGAGDQARTIKSIDLLLDAGANVNAQVTDSHTHTAMIMAYVAGRDQEGRTALMAAAEGGADKVVQHLLERGANPAIRDATGKTALDISKAAPPAAGPGAGAQAAQGGGAGAAAGAGAGAAAVPAPAGPPRGPGGGGGGRAATVALLEAAMAKTAK